MTAASIVIEAPADRITAYPLRIRLVDGDEFDFDADPIPIGPGGRTGRGVATRLVAAVRRRGLTTLDGWLVEADARRRVTLATGAVLWVDDRSPDEAPR